MSEPDYKQILINLCASTSLCDHLGDVTEDVYEALKQAKILDKEKIYEFDDTHDMVKYLAREHKAKTIFGTSFGEDDDDDE